MRVRVLVLTAVIGLLSTACGTGEVEISDARVGQPTGPNAALYLTATSGEADRLLGAETNVATAVELHETTVGDDGTVGMQRVETLEVGAGDSLVFEPGGFHLMLLDVERLDVGEEIEVTLFWENAGEMTVDAEVVAPADTMSDDS